MSAPERTLVTLASADRDYVRIDETVPTYLAADAAGLASIKSKHSPSPTNPVRAYRQDEGRFVVNLGGEWLYEDDIIVINGTAYQRSGWRYMEVTISSVSGGTYWASNVDVPMPAAPPGYQYVVDGIRSEGLVWAINHTNTAGGVLRVNLGSIVPRSNYGISLHWTLEENP